MNTAERIWIQLNFLKDYDDFDVANEDDVLEEFLGIPRKTPAAGEGTGTNAEGEVGKLEGEPVVNGDSDKRY